MRLGKLLIHSGVIDTARLDTALRQQVVYGGRLGTNLIELGYATVDDIGHALARLHHVPAALERHLDRHDPAVLDLIPDELAAAHTAFPIAFSMAEGKRLVLCMRDPADSKALAAIAAAARLEVVACVAPELAVYYWLERCYRIARSRRFAHATPGQSSPIPGSMSGSHPIVDGDDSIDVEFDFDIETAERSMPEEMQLVDLDHSDVERDHSQYNVDTRGLSSILDLAISATVDPPQSATKNGTAAAPAPAPPTPATPTPTTPTPTTPAPTTPTLTAPAPPPPAPQPPAMPPAPAAPTMSSAQAIAAITEAEHREEVSDAVIAFMRGIFAGGLILLVKDDLALGYRGFGGVFDESSVESIVIPLALPSFFKTVVDSGDEFVGEPPEDSHAIQERFFKLFPLADTPAMVAVIPVLIRKRMVCMYYVHEHEGDIMSAASVAELKAVATSAAQTFVRLIRGAKRRQTTPPQR